MKAQLLTACIIATLFGCKPAEPVTPADPIPGEYKLSGTVSYTIDGAVSSDPLSGTLSVYAGNTPGTYYFLERYQSTELGYLTNHNSSTFTVQGVPDYTLYRDVKYYGYQSGSGTVSGGTIKYERYADTNSPTHIAPTNNTTYYSKSIRKRVILTANK